MFTLLFLSALGGGWGEEPVKENGGADDDDDGDGLTNREEIEVYGSDPNLFSFYQDELIIVTAGVTPSDPTSLEENIRVYAIVISSTPIKPVNSLNFSVVLNYKTLTKNLKEEEMTLRVPKSLSRDSVITEWKPQAIEEIEGQGHSDDPVTVAYRYNFTFGIGQFSTGEEISYFIKLTRPDSSQQWYPHKGDLEPEQFEMVKVRPAIEVVSGYTDETIFALIFALFFGSLASARMKKRLSKMSYTDIQWWDAVNRKAFVKVIRIFKDVGEVRQVLKRISGRSIRFLYFTGITGLLMLSFELLWNPDEISQVSLGIISFFLMFTVISPVLYVYFTRWKHKNHAIGRIRILFFFLFPILIAASFSAGASVRGYVLIFMFFYSIPMLLYGNLMGTNWNFLIFNSFREFTSGFDHLNNVQSGIPKRIFAFFFFWAIFIMPILAINSLVALNNGTYEKGGFLGTAAEQTIKNFGYDYYAQMFASFIAIFIILNVILLGVAMVFRVVQLQFYASQKFSGKLGFGLKLHFKVRDNAQEQRRLIAFAFFVFFGYSVLLLLLAVYSQISRLLPTVPGLSADIFQEFLYYQSIFANIIFAFFWFVSIPRLPKMFRLKRLEGGFIIPK